MFDKKKDTKKLWSDGYGGGFLGIFGHVTKLTKLYMLNICRVFCVSIIIIISKDTLKSPL